jgi:hypothetical protein
LPTGSVCDAARARGRGHGPRQLPARVGQQPRPPGADAHDHTSGKVRGVTCGACNIGIGHFDAIAKELNERPRRTLNFTTPSQALAEALR